MRLFQFFHTSQFFPSPILLFLVPCFFPCLISVDSWGCDTIAVKSCSACSSVQFLFIHIVGLVVCEAKFEVTLTGLFLREFTAVEKISLGFFPSIFNSSTVFFLLQIIKTFKLCYCHCVRKGDCAK